MSNEWYRLRVLQPSDNVPEQLCGPTASPEINLVVLMVGSNIIGNDVVELAAQYMAEHARLELWMGGHEPQLSFPRRFEIGDLASDALLAVYGKWVEFESVYRDSGRKVDQVRGERERLKAALRRSIDILVRIRDE